LQVFRFIIGLADSLSEMFSLETKVWREGEEGGRRRRKKKKKKKKKKKVPYLAQDVDTSFCGSSGCEYLADGGLNYRVRILLDLVKESSGHGLGVF
jgi:hypothetical protein